MSQKNQKPMEQYFFRASAADFNKIPGSPIAYWVGAKTLSIVGSSKKLGDIADARMGLATGNNAKYVRQWSEVSAGNIGLLISNRDLAIKSGLRWFPYCKGGQFRKWFGNNEYVVDWLKDGEELQTTLHPSGARIWAHNFNLDHIFEDSLTWSDITSGRLSVRYNSHGFLFDGSGTCAFFKSEEEKLAALGFLNTQFANDFSKVLNPTLHFQTGDFRGMPYREELLSSVFINGVKELVSNAKSDWDSLENSWDFTNLSILHSIYRNSTLRDTYQSLRAHWREMTEEMQRLEEENNRLFIEAYGLQDELTSKVPLKEVTLSCNPHYRYGGVKTEAELEVQLQRDTMAEFLSYAVGCMFGRYSLDKPGLVLANQGDTLAEYLHQISAPRFMPAEDNVIPLLDGEWFADDVTERFRTFLRVTFGEEHYQENLAFIEQSLGKDVGKYFLKDFYTDHVRRYKKRPIYWLFSSPKGTFNALVYLHRYRPYTVSVVLQYLRDFRKKLASRLDYLQQVGISTSASQGEKTRALKEIETLKRQLLELDDYERDTLYPLATEQVALDLDDGVKVNYLKLGSALKKIVGLDAKGDE
ncbi:BREX-1 system adenine-specific DNA-methyltransferase PglX [Pseudomonas kitaguniensis]|uniref:BREX-1 system adenine-specific DNA-methyltransferase PglX n=1 Tax=Pseudomonas kitaguniensis TaxID=2607908 RepID=UPI003D02DC9E